MRHEAEARAALPRQGRALPGGWQAAAIAALAALAAGYLGRPGSATPRDAGSQDVSRVADVPPSELPAALGTVDVASRQVAQMAERDACGRRLAWVTVMRAPGQPAGRIRLQSGRYVSPAFDLLETPVRVALPYPAPYPVGRGTISVLGATADAVVALTPPWHVLSQAGMAAREVTWTPASGCPATR